MRRVNGKSGGGRKEERRGEGMSDALQTGEGKCEARAASNEPQRRVESKFRHGRTEQRDRQQDRMVARRRER